MRKGTFSVQTANANSSRHNSRELAPKYLIDSSQKNYYELITPDNEFKNIAQNIYKEKIKQTMQKKQVENLIQETVLTLQPNQDEKDVKDLFKKLNQKYGGHELLEVAIHRDEGYFLKDDIAYYPTKNILNKNGDWYVCSDTSIKKPKQDDFDKIVNIDEFEKVFNYHAHAKFSMFDRETGKSARMQKKDMSERIKFVSDELGLLFAPDKETSRIKKSVNLVKDEHLARARELETQKEIKQELQNTKLFTQVALAETKYLHKKYQAKITALENVENSLKKELHGLNNEIAKIKSNDELKSKKIQELEKRIHDLRLTNSNLDQINTEYSKISTETALKLEKQKIMINDLNEQKNDLKARYEQMSKQLINLRDDLQAPRMYKVNDLFHWIRVQFDQFITKIKELEERIVGLEYIKVLETPLTKEEQAAKLIKDYKLEDKITDSQFKKVVELISKSESHQNPNFYVHSTLCQVVQKIESQSQSQSVYQSR